VLGILSLPCAVFAAIPAVICGHIALKNISKSAGARTGRGMAVAGLIMGYVGVLILGVALLSGLAAPLVIRQRKKADQAEAMNNARSFGLALQEFKTEYGRFPDETTAARVAEAAGTPGISGNSANDRFRQLIQSGIIQSESLFHANAAGVRIPDGLIDADNFLAPGECAFAYVENVVTTDATARPLAMTPFVPGTLSFDHLPFDNKAVILWTDNSVRSLPIDRNTGEVMLDGRNLLDPDHPIWAGKPPMIALPE
jgi:type II secretory pathway pseudopilin PulG